MVKILIVDDSAFMRKLLTDLFSAELDFSVVDTARNGKDAIEKAKRLKPDIITMDVEMPIMDGIHALEVIMREMPTPIVMVSSLTRDGAEATIRALDLGAVDFVAKTAGAISNITSIREELLSKCRAAARANVAQLTKPRSISASTPQKVNTPYKAFDIATKPSVAPLESSAIVAIGTSTGGPRALQEVITKLPGDLPCGVLVVQHMPPGFTKSLADRLNSISALSVKEAEHNDLIRPGLVLIAPGDRHMLVERDGDKNVVKLNQNPAIGGHRPAVDPMMESVARVYGERTVGVILTGMGHDGSKGMLAIKQQRGYTIAEDQSTSVVFGMPKSAIEVGAVDKVVPLPLVPGEIIKALTY